MSLLNIMTGAKEHGTYLKSMNVINQHFVS